MTPSFFSLCMIGLCLTVLAAIGYIALVRGILAEFFWKVGFVLSHVFGGIADLFFQLWIDFSGLFRKKKKVKLDEYEKKISS